MKVFALLATAALAAKKDDLDQRNQDFLTVLRDEGYTRFADRFDRILGKALNAIPMAETSVDGCNNLWAPFSEADDAWDPATATKCQYARKVARSYLRWTKNNLCLDNLEKEGKRETKKIQKRFDFVIDFMWNRKFCEDETP